MGLDVVSRPEIRMWQCNDIKLFFRLFALAETLVLHILRQPLSTRVSQRMHHALEIQEILCNIFLYCAPPENIPLNAPPKSSIVVKYMAAAHRNLTALAGTCRAFKEPALDVKWMVSIDLSLIARCLPGASRRASPLERVVRWFQPLSRIA